jgi:uncharacterized coiled-coil protein SlyX
MTDESTVFDAAFEYQMNGMSEENARVAASEDKTKDARIAELENALAAAFGTIAAMRADVTTGQALIAELADALQSILRVPNSEAAQGIMKVFASMALKPKP